MLSDAESHQNKLVDYFFEDCEGERIEFYLLFYI